MKKMIVTIMCTMFVLNTITACSNSDADVSEAVTTTAETTTATEAATTESAAEPIVLDVENIEEYLAIEVSFDEVKDSGSGILGFGEAETNAVITTYPYKSGKFNDLEVEVRIFHTGWENSNSEMNSIETLKIPFDGKVTKKIKLINEAVALSTDEPEFKVFIYSVSGTFTEE